MGTLPLTSAMTSSSPCFLCRPGDSSVPYPYRLVQPDMDVMNDNPKSSDTTTLSSSIMTTITSSTTCLEVAMEALFALEGSRECMEYFRFIGYTKCGCEPPPPPLTPPVEIYTTCSLCPNGNTVSSSSSNPIEMYDQSYEISCVETERFLSLYHINEDNESCSTFQQSSSCPCIEDHNSNNNNDNNNSNNSNSMIDTSAASTSESTSSNHTFIIGIGIIVVIIIISIVIVGTILIKRTKTYRTKRKNGILLFSFTNQKNHNKNNDDSDDDNNNEDDNYVRSNSKHKFRSEKCKGSHKSSSSIIGKRNDDYRPKNYNQVMNDGQEEHQQQQQLSSRPTTANVNDEISIDTNSKSVSTSSSSSSYRSDETSTLFRMEEAHCINP